MALVLADRQTAGRGRGANRWWTGAGSLAFSLLLHPAARGIRRENFPLISLTAALAIIDAARPLASADELGLHWPNDVFAQGRKLAGVLVEALTDGWHVLGVGLNVNNRAIDAPDELREKTISLADLTGRDQSRTDALLALFSAALAQSGPIGHGTGRDCPPGRSCLPATWPATHHPKRRSADDGTVPGHR